jgi:SAM-dependent methyltransferase
MCSPRAGDALGNAERVNTTDILLCSSRQSPRHTGVVTRGFYNRAPVTGPIEHDDATGHVEHAPMDTVGRRLLARHIIGAGVELGPGHVPFPLGPGTTVRYVDRWAPDQNRELFPELADAAFPRPHIVANLDTDRLSALADESQDFVIASHVLEHLAEPIGLIVEIHRVLRPGGVVLILLPDRHRTFDRHREPTSLAHLVAEYAANVTEVDDTHISEFLEKTGTPLGDSPEADRATIELHRRRSIHVHCWTDEEFFPVLRYGVEHLGQRWEFVDGTVTDDEGPSGVEFGFVLRRGQADVTSAAVKERLEGDWRTWRDARFSMLQMRGDREAEEELRVEVAQLRQELASVSARMDRIDATAPMRIYRAGKRVLRRHSPPR